MLKIQRCTYFYVPGLTSVSKVCECRLQCWHCECLVESDWHCKQLPECGMQLPQNERVAATSKSPQPGVVLSSSLSGHPQWWLWCILTGTMVTMARMQIVAWINILIAHLTVSTFRTILLIILIGTYTYRMQFQHAPALVLHSDAVESF